MFVFTILVLGSTITIVKNFTIVLMEDRRDFIIFPSIFFSIIAKGSPETHADYKSVLQGSFKLIRNFCDDEYLIFTYMVS